MGLGGAEGRPRGCANLSGHSLRDWSEDMNVIGVSSESLAVNGRK